MICSNHFSVVSKRLSIYPHSFVNKVHNLNLLLLVSEIVRWQVKTYQMKSPVVQSELEQASFPETKASSRTPPKSRNKVQVHPLKASADGCKQSVCDNVMDKC